MNRYFISLLVSLVACTPKENPEAPTPPDTGEPEIVEDGCIRINGTGGWPSIKSALNDAVDGDVILLCAGSYPEKVQIEKAVTIKGPNSGEPAIIVGPEGDSAISIRNDNVTLSWITVESDDMGVYVRDVDGVVVQAVSVTESVGPAIRAAGSTNLLLQACNFSDTPASALLIDGGGSATLLNNNFEGSIGYAVLAMGGSTLTLEGNDFASTIANEDGTNTAVRATELATVISNNNLYTGNTGYGIHADSADIQSSNDTFIGGTYAVFSNNGTVDISNAAITNPTTGGVRARTSSHTLSVSNSAVTTDPENSDSLTSAEWRSNTASGVGLHLASGTSINVTDVTVTGFNNAGLYLSGMASSEPEVLVEGLTVTNVGWLGLHGQEANFTIDDLTVTGLREVEDLGADQCTSVGTNGALNLNGGSATINNATLTDNDGYGIAVVSGETSISRVTAARNACSGVINFSGSMYIDDSDFSEPVYSELNASVVGYESDATHVTNSRFTDGSSLTEYRREEYDFGTAIYTYVYTGRVGNDIRFFSGGDNLVEGNTFSDGAESIFVYESDATVQDNTWTDYSSYAAYFSNGVESSVFQNNVYENSSGHIVACDTSTVSVSNIEVNRTLSASYGGYEILIDGVSSGSYSDPINAYPASHFNSCTATINNATYTDTVATALYASGGTIDLDTVSVARASAEGIFGAAAINLDASILPTTASIHNLTVTEHGFGSALSMEGTMDADGFTANLVASDILVNGSQGDAIELFYTDSTIDEVSLSGMDGSGLYIAGGIVRVDGGVISGSGSEGVYATGAEVSLTDLFVLNSDSHGVMVDAGTLAATDNSIKENTGNGVMLSSTESSSLSGNIITDNESFGLHCGDSSFLVCENEISGNTLGATDDCGPACGFEATDVDGGDDPIDGDDDGSFDDGSFDEGSLDDGDDEPIDDGDEPIDDGGDGGDGGDGTETGG